MFDWLNKDGRSQSLDKDMKAGFSSSREEERGMERIWVRPGGESNRKLQTCRSLEAKEDGEG